MKTKRMRKMKHLGSNFDDFLREEGILEECEAAAIKRILAYQLESEMQKNAITQTEMAKRLKTSRTAVRRLLDPENYSITLITLDRLAHVLGKQLEIRLTPIRK